MRSEAGNVYHLPQQNSWTAEKRITLGFSFPYKEAQKHQLFKGGPPPPPTSPDWT